MNSRQKQIIRILKDAKDPVTSSLLSADLQVSSKTIRNEIQKLNQILQKHNMSIDSFRGKGYKLEAADEVAFNEFLQEMEKIKEIIPVEPSDRVTFLIERLLLHSSYEKMEELAEELYISRSTLQSDLKKVREILHEYDLSLDHKPNYGIKVNGSETNIRFCISEYIFNQPSSVMEDNPNWVEILPQKEQKVIRNSILTQLRKHRIIISDVSLQNLMTHLAIAYKRIREDNHVEIIHSDLYEIKGQKEFTVAEQIIRDIENVLKVSFPKDEVAYLAIHLQGTKLMGSDKDTEKIKSVIDKEIRVLATEMVERIDEKYHFNLSDDKELLMNLALHLKPAVNRYIYQMNIRNPMLEEIKAKYPTSFEAALIGSEVLDEKAGIHVDEHEIGYLALHIEVAQERMKKLASRRKSCLIVCATGLGSAQLLLYKLKDKFGEMLNVKGTTELYNLHYQSLNDIDFIVSTIPIDDDTGIPVVHVSTILGESDVNRIEKVMTNERAVIHQYMREHLTFLNCEFETPEEVIRFLGNQLGALDRSISKNPASFHYNLFLCKKMEMI
ncbi:BglG family transcription antiterminator [Lentibacillus salicampi]|uniref:Transcription antiterminator n=1 Tax=Lentibacillus salicampi TaxID=175306 RepID=A0A4Y9ABG7_9BACI|nr:transcription antiterminator [Lentibacillus salicampi]TFJ91681.1 transcription antiterminator [Lentibacillus salicampi]